MKTGLLDEFEAARREMAKSAIGISDLVLDAGTKKIDGLFGKGFAQANPALVGQYLDATLRTFQGDMASVAQSDEDLDVDELLGELDRRR